MGRGSRGSRRSHFSLSISVRLRFVRTIAVSWHPAIWNATVMSWSLYVSVWASLCLRTFIELLRVLNVDKSDVT